MSKETKTNIQLYVLGLLYFEKDTERTAILSRKQLATIGWMFASTIFADSKPDAGDDDTYFKFKLSDQDNPQAFRDFIGPNLIGIIKEVQFGYYHHRAIFRLTFNHGTKLHVLRNARSEAYRLIREKCFDRFSGLEIKDDNLPGITGEPLHLEYIYSYSLILIPRGLKTISDERRQMKKLKYDDIFTTRSTTFGLYLPERGTLLIPKRHYLRISVLSTVMYLDGKSCRPDLLNNLIDAIYYGGLYQKIKHDRGEGLKTTQHYSDPWTNDRLLSVLSVINDSVSTNEMGYISVHTGRLAVIIGIAAIIISVIISVLLSK